MGGGIYALSTQIVLLDCLSDTYDLDPKYVTRLVIRDSDVSISDQFSLISWLATLVSLHGNRTLITMASNQAHKYKGDKL